MMRLRHTEAGEKLRDWASRFLGQQLTRELASTAPDADGWFLVVDHENDLTGEIAEAQDADYEQANDMLGCVRRKSEAITQIETALGAAIASSTNPCGYIVQQVEGGYRIADDWTHETLPTAETAVEYAGKCLEFFLGTPLNHNQGDNV